MKKWKPYLRPLLPILALVAIGYSNIYHSPFVYDDLPYILRNANLRSIQNLGALWHFAPTRFLTYFSLFLNYQISGENVVSYHIVNVLIHAANVVIVYFLTLALLCLPGFSLGDKRKSVSTSKDASDPFKKSVAFLMALVFAIHPIQTEAVTYTWQRGASLAALFYFSSLLCYINSALTKSKRLLWASFWLAFAAMFTKQTAATLPISILLIEYFGIGWTHGQSVPRKKRLIPLLATILIIPLTMLLFGDYDWAETHSTIVTAIYIPSHFEYLFTQINVVRDYYRLLLFPLTQMVDYDVPFIKSLWHLNALASLAFHLFVLGSAVHLRKRWPLFSFGVFFFYLTLSVESSFVPLADAEFEHRLYLPSFGFFIAVIFLGNQVLKYVPTKLKIVPVYAGALVFLVASLGYLTWNRNRVWNSTESFWKDAALKAPNKSRTLTSYGRIIQVNGQIPEATVYLERAVKIDPRNTMAELSLALLYAQTGQMRKALQATQRLSKVSTELPEYNYAMGGIYLMSGDEGKAIELLKRAVSPKALSMNSPDADFVRTNAYENLIKMAIQKGDADAIVENAQKFLEFQPDRKDIRSRLAYAFSKKGDLASAEREYAVLLQIDPNDYETYNNLAILMELQKKPEKAAALLEQAIQIRPKDPAPRVNLILILTSMGNREKAGNYYRNLMDLGQDGWKTYAMMARGFFDKGYCDLSIDPMKQVIRLSPPTESHMLVEMHSKLAECYSRLGDRDLASLHRSEARSLTGPK